MDTMNKKITSLKNILGALYAFFSRLRYRGRLNGTNFLIRKPDLVRIGSLGKVEIGFGTYFEKGLRFVARDKVSIGEHVYVGKNSTLIAFSELSIGSNTLIGENVSIHTENHGKAQSRLEYESRPIFIGRNVWIGAGVIITAGVTIGDDCTIGANAVVTKSIPAGKTAVGVPAKVL